VIPPSATATVRSVAGPPTTIELSAAVTVCTTPGCPESPLSPLGPIGPAGPGEMAKATAVIGSRAVRTVCPFVSATSRYRDDADGKSAGLSPGGDDGHGDGGAEPAPKPKLMAELASTSSV
jgi:hypothetical protein